MEFEYDPDKSKANAKKHGIDFEQATRLWNYEKRVEFVARFADEPRLGLSANMQTNYGRQFSPPERTA